MKAPWLEPFTLAEGETATFRIACLALQITRRAHEWRIQSATTTDLSAVDVDVRLPDPAPGPLPFQDDARLSRWAFDQGHDTLVLRPRLADRTVVVRPADALYLLPGAALDVYVSTVVWIGLELAQPSSPSSANATESGVSGTVLLDRPALRPSDTWFGPSTREGELAYASRTSARLDVRELPARPHRATTRIRLQNVGRQPRSLARVMLPAPSLELWRVPSSGMLWTQTVELTLDDGDESPLRLKPGPPTMTTTVDDVLDTPLLVASARVASVQKNFLARAMSAIF